jgi:autotransporter-associated beta strand protein
LIDTRAAPDGFALTINPAGGASTPILLDADAGLPVFLPPNDEVWHSASNWSSGIIPNASGATAIIDAPSTADRTVQMDSSTTIGRLHFRQANSNYQHSIRNSSPTAALTFHGGDHEAIFRVDGSGGSGHIDVDFTNPISLSTDLILLVNQSEGGHLQHGALRLQHIWNGSGGLIKQGPGVATLSGEGKNFTGPFVVEQGVLRIESQAVPVATSGLVIQPGGQLRLISAGTMITPAQHNFGGGIIQIGGSGLGGDPLASPQQGILGAMRYEPATLDSTADLLNPLLLTAATHLHVEGASNFLRLHGEITGNDHLISKTGPGTLILIAASPNASPVSVFAGTLAINNNYPAPISLTHSDAILTGIGSTGPISGVGNIFPGVGGLTAPSASAARIASRLFTPGLGGNESLILTHPSQPFVSEPQIIDLFLPASRLTGQRFHGGIVVDPEFSLSTTQVRLLVPDPAGDIIHYGIHYRVATAADMLTLSTVTLPEGRTLEVFQRGDAQSFTQWRNLHFADPDARANPNISGPSMIDPADGIAHLIRYAHGIAPGEQVAPWLPRMIRSNQDEIVFRFRYDSNKSGIAWIVRSSIDLNDWSSSVFDSRTHSPPPASADGWTELVVPQAETKHFFRLEVRELP